MFFLVNDSIGFCLALTYVTSAHILSAKASYNNKVEERSREGQFPQETTKQSTAYIVKSR